MIMYIKKYIKFYSIYDCENYIGELHQGRRSVQ